MNGHGIYLHVLVDAVKNVYIIISHRISERGTALLVALCVAILFALGEWQEPACFFFSLFLFFFLRGGGKGAYTLTRICVFCRRTGSDPCSLRVRLAGLIIAMTVPLIANAWAILINEPSPRYAGPISIGLI